MGNDTEAADALGQNPGSPTTIAVKEAPSTEQTAGATIGKIGEASPAPTFVTTGRCLVEELHTPLNSTGSDSPDEVVTTVSYQYDKEGKAYTATLVDDIQHFATGGKTYSREQLDAYIAALQTISARL